MASEIMPTYQSTPPSEHSLSESTGILVVNLGTPDAPTAAAVRRFLKQFLFDPRVVEYPRLLWWCVLNLVILQIRPPRSAAAYRKIWTDQGSPLLIHSRAITNKLRDRLASRVNVPVRVELAMTYGKPSIDDAIDKLLAAGARRILTVPLYPQYSSTTTAAVFDAVGRKMARLRRIPESRFIHDYHDASPYIEALASSVRESWAAKGRGEKLLMSFHGIPASSIENGDPYHDQCQRTARLLADELGLDEEDWLISFQSRVGREDWLAPYTDETVRSLGEKGLSRLDVVCPGFSTDCLETLEEIAMQSVTFFKSAGGESLQYIPALNARKDHVRFLVSLVTEHVADWTNDASPKALNAPAKAVGESS